MDVPDVWDVVRSMLIRKAYLCPASRFNILCQADWIASGGQYHTPMGVDQVVTASNGKTVTLPKGEHCLVSAVGEVFILK